MYKRDVFIIFSIVLMSLFFLPESKATILSKERVDSLIAFQLRKKGVHFTKNNSVVLLKNGKEKFEDLFRAIEQARSSIHLEYFNFRNDSINNELIKPSY